MTLEQRVNDYVAGCLATRTPGKPQSKFVHDPIWGTIEVKPYEAAILDTPLLQRLRHIHQTGFVFQTYPSARHSRFEHTVGVMHAAGRIAQVLQAKYKDEVDPVAIQRVRLAAILHDTGHSAFSHTSEETYSSCADIHEYKSRITRFGHSGGGEILSYLIATSAAFKKFYAELQEDYSELKADVGEFALLITGKTDTPARYFEGEIISGAFDADKLDYFPRDGRAAGIQLALDTDRLLHCLEIENDPKDKKRRVLVVNRGGFNPLQQLLFARATLFATVYHHQKVRACDSMVKGCFEYWQKSSDHQFSVNGKKLPLTSAADFLYLNDQVFFGQAGILPEGSFPQVQITRLLTRALAKRVLIISTRTLKDFESSATPVGYQKFRDLNEDHEGLRDLADRVLKDAGSPCAKHEFWIDIPVKPNLDKAGRALIRVSKDPEKGLQELATLIPVKQWVETYSQYFSQCLIFGPPEKEARISLCVSAIKIFREEFKLRMNFQAIPEDIRDEVNKRLPVDPAPKIFTTSFVPELTTISTHLRYAYVSPTEADAKTLWDRLCEATGVRPT